MADQWAATHSRSAGEASAVPTIPDFTLAGMAEILGTMPDGDVPAAWYSSTHPDVLTGWEKYKKARYEWQGVYDCLLDELGLARGTMFMTAAKSHFVGLVPPKGAKKPPRYMRIDKNGYWVPRKRTQEEKTSKPHQLFAELEHIPQAEEFVPGMPNTLWTHFGAYPVILRKPAQAVLAFVATNPDDADPPFEVGPQWSRMKLSTYHLLRERQEAGKR